MNTTKTARWILILAKMEINFHKYLLVDKWIANKFWYIHQWNTPEQEKECISDTWNNMAESWRIEQKKL